MVSRTAVSATSRRTCSSSNVAAAPAALVDLPEDLPSGRRQRVAQVGHGPDVTGGDDDPRPHRFGQPGNLLRHRLGVALPEVLRALLVLLGRPVARLDLADTEGVTLDVALAGRVPVVAVRGDVGTGPVGDHQHVRDGIGEDAHHRQHVRQWSPRSRSPARWGRQPAVEQQPSAGADEHLPGSGAVIAAGGLAHGMERGLVRTPGRQLLAPCPPASRDLGRGSFDGAGRAQVRRGEGTRSGSLTTAEPAHWAGPAPHAAANAWRRRRSR